jgi:glutamate 5-kinase
VATDEIRYGDNDRLAAQVAVTAGADLLVLLSDVDGLYTANPQTDADARHIPHVAQITPGIMAMAGDAGSGLSKGGMKTKLMAARTATAGGCALAITRGDADHPLAALAQGARATWFAAQGTPQQKRKAWIAAMKPRGRFAVDAGAARALASGSSLLPAGVGAVAGSFGRGDPVEMTDAEGRVLGQGLTRYDSGDATRITGLRLDQVEAVLGYPARGPLIHRDDMAI